MRLSPPAALNAGGDAVYRTPVRGMTPPSAAATQRFHLTHGSGHATHLAPFRDTASHSAVSDAALLRGRALQSIFKLAQDAIGSGAPEHTVAPLPEAAQVQVELRHIVTEIVEQKVFAATVEMKAHMDERLAEILAAMRAPSAPAAGHMSTTRHAWKAT
ncbi:MAG: hypothetical protein EOO65_02885 [Methanosarcinales archaeon]|nr:MAG: hypothetical protein EOO65_02885 [Methanosarcinales archaeon]